MWLWSAVLSWLDESRWGWIVQVAILVLMLAFITLVILAVSPD